MSRRKSIITGLVAAAAALGVVVAAPAAAFTGNSAGTADTTGYLAALHSAGFPSSIDTAAVGVGNQVCELMRNGISEDSIVAYVSNTKPDVPRWATKTIVSDAHTYLCPEAVK